MPHLRLVTDADHDVADVESAADRTRPFDDRPRVSLRLLMAASGRCSCDGCLLAFRRGDRSAGLVRAGDGARLTARR